MVMMMMMMMMLMMMMMMMNIASGTLVMMMNTASGSLVVMMMMKMNTASGSLVMKKKFGSPKKISPQKKKISPEIFFAPADCFLNGGSIKSIAYFMAKKNLNVKFTLRTK